jgi:hypothetical protein
LYWEYHLCEKTVKEGQCEPKDKKAKETHTEAEKDRRWWLDLTLVHCGHRIDAATLWLQGNRVVAVGTTPAAFFNRYLLCSAMANRISKAKAATIKVAGQKNNGATNANAKSPEFVERSRTNAASNTTTYPAAKLFKIRVAINRGHAITSKTAQASDGQ